MKPPATLAVIKLIPNFLESFFKRLDRDDRVFFSLLDDRLFSFRGNTGFRKG
ncbi:MAG: hypothetical protein PWK00_01320 [Coxiella burnetii]|nr:hypothetical protein [Coxiella burnetii]